MDWGSNVYSSNLFAASSAALFLPSRMRAKVIMILVAIMMNNKKKAVHLEDNELTKLTWKRNAAKAGVQLWSFSSPDDLIFNLENFEKSTVFYLDYDLGKGQKNGLQVAEKLQKLEFTEVFMASSHEGICWPGFIKGNVGKIVPF